MLNLTLSSIALEDHTGTQGLGRPSCIKRQTKRQSWWTGSRKGYMTQSLCLSERCQPQEGPVFDERPLYHLIAFGTRDRLKSPIRR